MPPKATAAGSAGASPAPVKKAEPPEGYVPGRGLRHVVDPDPLCWVHHPGEPVAARQHTQGLRQAIPVPDVAAARLRPYLREAATAPFCRLPADAWKKIWADQSEEPHISHCIEVPGIPGHWKPDTVPYALSAHRDISATKVLHALSALEDKDPRKDKLMMSPNLSFAKGKVRQRQEFVRSFHHKLRVHSVAVDVPFANTRADPVAPAPTAKLDALEMRILPAGVPMSQPFSAKDVPRFQRNASGSPEGSFSKNEFLVILDGPPESSHRYLKGIPQQSLDQGITPEYPHSVLPGSVHERAIGAVLYKEDMQPSGYTPYDFRFVLFNTGLLPAWLPAADLPWGNELLCNVFTLDNKEGVPGVFFVPVGEAPEDVFRMDEESIRALATEKLAAAWPRQIAPLVDWIERTHLAFCDHKKLSNAEVLGERREATAAGAAWLNAKMREGVITAYSTIAQISALMTDAGVVDVSWRLKKVCKILLVLCQPPVDAAKIDKLAKKLVEHDFREWQRLRGQYEQELRSIVPRIAQTACLLNFLALIVNDNPALMRDLLQRTLGMVPRSRGQNTRSSFGTLVDIIVPQLIQDKYGKAGSFTSGDCRDILEEHRARVESVLGSGVEDGVLIQHMRQRITDNIDRWIYKHLCRAGEVVPRNHLCVDGSVANAGVSAFDFRDIPDKHRAAMDSILAERLSAIRCGVSGLAHAQRSGRTSWAGVVLDPSLPNFLRVLLFLATWDLGIVADAFPQGGDEDHRHQFMDLRSSLETMMCQPTGNGVTFDAITTPEAAMVIKAAMPFVAERTSASWFGRIVRLSQWDMLDGFCGENIGGIVRKAAVGGDIKIAEFAGTLADEAISAIMRVDAQPGSDSLTRAADLDAVLAAIQHSGQRRRAAWAVVLQATAVRDALRGAIARQQRASESLTIYCAQAQRQSAGDLFSKMRGARLHVMAIRSPENGGTGAVKETTLDGLIRTSTGPGWQEQLRKAVQAHRLEGHPLCGSMRVFLKDIKEICDEMQSTTPHDDISHHPILNLVRMILDGGSMWLLGRGGGGSAPAHMQQENWQDVLRSLFDPSSASRLGGPAAEMLKDLLPDGIRVAELSQQPGLASLPGGASLSAHACVYGPANNLQRLKDILEFAMTRSQPVYAVNLLMVLILMLCPLPVVGGAPAYDFMLGLPIAIDGEQLLQYVRDIAEGAPTALANEEMMGPFQRCMCREFARGEALDQGSVVEILDMARLPVEGGGHACFYGKEAEVLWSDGDSCHVITRAQKATLTVRKTKLWRRDSFACLSTMGRLFQDASTALDPQDAYSPAWLGLRLTTRSMGPVRAVESLWDCWMVLLYIIWISAKTKLFVLLATNWHTASFARVFMFGRLRRMLVGWCGMATITAGGNRLPIHMPVTAPMFRDAVMGAGPDVRTLLPRPPQQASGAAGAASDDGPAEGGDDDVEAAPSPRSDAGDYDLLEADDGEEEIPETPDEEVAETP